MKNLKFVATALVTPFDGGQIDYGSLKKLIRFQLDNGISGLIVNGTTAESPTLTSTEKSKLLEFVKIETSGQVPIVMGTGSNSTAATIEDSKIAEREGADAVLVVVPYYNKPPQRGLIAHFNSVANAISIPTILYNVPGRTVTALAIESIVELSKNPKIRVIKEASGNISFAKEIRSKCNKEFILLSGDDGSYVDFLKAGGNGVISVATHVIPKQFVNWTRDVLDGKLDNKLDVKNVDQDFSRYGELIKLLFCEANPIPVKMALHKMGILKSPELRLPLTTLTPELTETLVGEMKKTGVLL